MNKHLGCLLCKILGTILKMNKRRTLTNGPEDKKTDDDAQGLTFERRHICIEKGWRVRASNEDSVDESIWGLVDNIKKISKKVICRCLPRDRTRHKVNEPKVNSKWGLGEEQTRHEPRLEPSWLSTDLVQCGPDEPRWSCTKIWVQARTPDYSFVEGNNTQQQ